MEFVVDENVVLNAVRGKNDLGKEAWAEGEFMHRLFRVPSKVFVNEAIAKKFFAMGAKIRAGSRPEDCNNKVYKDMAAMLKNTARVTYVEGTRVEWPGLKKCDREFVGVALQTGGVLVTSDARLRQIVKEMRLRGLRVECVGVDRALCLLRQPGGQGGSGRMARPGGPAPS